MSQSLRKYWDLLKKYLSNHWKLFFLTSILLISSILMQIFNPQIMKRFIDATTSGKSFEDLLLLAIMFVGIAVIQQVLSIFSTYTSEIVAWNATNEIRSDLLRHCLFLDMSFHNETTPGQLIEKVDGDVQQLSNFFSQFVISIAGNLLLLVGILIFLFIENIFIGLIFTFYSVIAIFILHKIKGIAIPYFKKVREANSKIFGYIEERLTGAEDIKANGAVDYVISGIYKLHYRLLKHRKKSADKIVIMRLFGGLIVVFGNLIALSTGFYLYKEGLASLGLVYLIIHYTNMLARPINALVNQSQNMQNIGANLERITELLNTKRKFHEGNRTFYSEDALNLEFENVNFSYNKKEKVLTNLSFEVKQGNILGILGRTGSGKTTISRLIFRLYDLCSGNIKLNNENINNFTLSSLRNQIAIVTQDVQLFKASVRDNLTLFNRNISDTKILEAINQLHLTDWFNSLENGLDTKLSSDNSGLSAGEAQLLAFTRIFLRNPNMIILDEASSRLDPATEKLIDQAVEKLLENRTAIIIAHRLSTIQKADQILILDSGKIAEFGRREILTKNPDSRLSSLLKTGLEEVLV